jgi:hypothetical protein
MPARVRRLPLAVLVGLVSAACSRPSSSSGDPPSVQERFAHPCQLLPKADAQQVLGQVELASNEEPAGSPGDARCVWNVVGGRGFVDLRVHVPSRKDEMKQGGAGRRNVPGVGDLALARTKGGWGDIEVLKGDQTFLVQIHGAARVESPDKADQDAVQIARLVAARL